MEQDIEIWKDIEGYEGLYLISNMGRLKSIERVVKGGYCNRYICIKKERQRSIIYCGDGYGRVMLFKNGKHKGYLIHRLVGLHFIPNPENKPEVNHKFGFKKDNRASQLEWHTPMENMQHAHRTGLKKGVSGSANGSAKLVLDLQTGIFYETAKEAAVAKNYKYVGLSAKLCGNKRNNTSLQYV